MSGPSFFLNSPGRFSDIGHGSESEKSLQAVPRQLLSNHKPKAILLVSAHWEESDAVHITSRDSYDKLMYDYYGFPAEAYKIEYKAPGNSQLASQVKELLTGKGITSVLDNKRDWDHGVFVPLKVMYPEADIPIVQISLLASLNPRSHIEIGKALAPLRDEGVLIVGSGFMTHNFNPVKAGSHAFVKALVPLLTKSTPEEREKGLLNWASLPGARESHAREEHLIPLHVVAGAAGNDVGHELATLWIMNDEWAFGNVAFGQIAK